MSKFISLLKASMSEGMNFFNYRAKSVRGRKVMPIALGLLIGLLMFFSAFTMARDLKEDGSTAVVLSVYAFITTVVILMEGIYKSGELLFRSRDNDKLLSMPIPRSTIVSVRILKFYIFELLYVLIFFLPAVLAYALNESVSFSYYLVAGTGIVLLPIVPIVVSCFLGAILMAVSARLRNQTFWQVLLSFLFLGLFIIPIILMNFSSDFGGGSIAGLARSINKFYYPSGELVKLALDFDFWHYILYIGIHLLVAGFSVLLIAKYYFRIVSRLNVVRKVDSNGISYSFRSHTPIMAMIKKEITKYFSTPILLTNTSIGLVLFLIGVLVICFNFDGVVSSLTSSVDDFPLTSEQIHDLMPCITFMLVAFSSLMTFITTTMISLEGRAFNMLKTMPISGLRIIMTKVVAAMLLIVPFTFLGSTVMAIRFQFGFFDFLLVLIGVIVIPLMTELIGILIDLKYARFDAENDAVVVKQSAGVMASTFLGLFMVLVSISMTFAVVFLAGQGFGLLIMDGVFIVVSLFLLMVVGAKGEEKIMRLSA